MLLWPMVGDCSGVVIIYETTEGAAEETHCFFFSGTPSKQIRALQNIKEILQDDDFSPPGTILGYVFFGYGIYYSLLYHYIYLFLTVYP